MSQIETTTDQGRPPAGDVALHCPFCGSGDVEAREVSPADRFLSPGQAYDAYAVECLRCGGQGPIVWDESPANGLLWAQRRFSEFEKWRGYSDGIDPADRQEEPAMPSRSETDRRIVLSYAEDAFSEDFVDGDTGEPTSCAPEGIYEALGRLRSEADEPEAVPPAIDAQAEDRTAPRVRHPDQPQRRVDGVLRFQSNPLVEELLGAYPDGLYGITRWSLEHGAPDDDRRQLRQLDGYSLDVYRDLDFVTAEDWARVDPERAPGPTTADESLARYSVTVRSPDGSLRALPMHPGDAVSIEAGEDFEDATAQANAAADEARAGLRKAVAAVAEPAPYVAAGKAAVEARRAARRDEFFRRTDTEPEPMEGWAALRGSVKDTAATRDGLADEIIGGQKG